MTTCKKEQKESESLPALCLAPLTTEPTTLAAKRQACFPLHLRYMVGTSCF